MRPPWRRRAADRVFGARDPHSPRSARRGGSLSGDSRRLIREVLSRSRRRQRLAFTLVEHDRLVDDAAELVENRPLVVAVASAEDQAGRTADVALILLGPLDGLHVAGTLLHRSDSSIAN